jgi:uncharacterized protein YggL (DUF469 family)
VAGHTDRGRLIAIDQTSFLAVAWDGPYKFTDYSGERGNAASPIRGGLPVKKRLRKKHRLGEFTEWGHQLIILRNREDGFDEFLSAFIEEAVEANGCECGGAGTEDKLDVVVEIGRQADDPTGKLRKVTAWLDARPDVREYKTGPVFDLWSDSWEEIEMKMEIPEN